MSSLVSCLRSLALGIGVSSITGLSCVFCLLLLILELLGALFVCLLLFVLSPSDVCSPSEVLPPSESCGGLCLVGRMPGVLALVTLWCALGACLMFFSFVGVEEVGVKV